MRALSAMRLAVAVGVGAATACGGAGAAPSDLPPEVRAALAQAHLGPEALVAFVADVSARPGAPPRLAHRAAEPDNPASLMKLYSTGAALELLGPAWSWSTPVLVDGEIDAGGVLRGDLVIQGRGDPTLVPERLWLLLREVQRRGIREVHGDIVLDGSAFAAPERGSADFDGDGLRPYNVQPDALLFNLKAITLQFLPDPPRRAARVTSDVTLAGVRIDPSVPLVAAECGDWRTGLKADFSDPTRLRFGGSYPANCGERSWPIAYPDAASYDARLLESLWDGVGGRLGGRVRSGPTPPGATTLFAFESPPLAAVVRDINKFSNNVMAQQLFLSLALAAGDAPARPPRPSRPDPAAPVLDLATASARGDGVRPATPEAARLVLREAIAERTGCVEPELRVDNGSGLSREGRTSARCLGAWLRAMWDSPVMPELMSSLPVSGVDGTTRRPGRSWGAALGRAHLKTGSLRDAAGIAGYVLASSGRRYVVVAILNHPDAGAGRAALDALVRWTAQDAAP